MRTRYLLVSLVFLSACPICPDGALDVVEGSTPLKPGGSIQFTFRYGGATYSTPTHCGGHWYVNGVEGGTDATGRITNCGRYTAPMTPLSEPLLIEASEYPPNECADCCPYASTSITMANVP